MQLYEDYYQVAKVIYRESTLLRPPKFYFTSHLFQTIKEKRNRGEHQIEKKKKKKK